jgi:uncharacterized damage-inducible protein DinB
MNKEISRQVENLKFCQNLAMDILKMLTDEQLDFTVGKNMGTLGEQFRHMTRVRLQYSEALETKKVEPTKETIDPFIAKSKERLVELWEKVNQKIPQILQKMSAEELENLKIDWKHWGVDSMDIYSHLQALIDHENLHNGQIIVYVRTLDLKFPESWKAWGL